MSLDFVKVLNGTENVTGLLNGVNKLADCVGATLGPRGCNVLIQQETGAPKITKDGVTVAKSIRLDGIEGQGARVIQDIAAKSGDQVGDGTTTATILGREIVTEGFKLIQAGYPAVEIQRGVEYAVNEVVGQLSTMSVPVSTSEDTYNVALVSSNGDKKMASLIRDAFEKSGEDGTIVVDNSTTNDDWLDISEGYTFDRGYYNNITYFVNEPENMKAVYEKPLILLMEDKLDNIQDLETLFNVLSQKISEPLVLIAQDFDPIVMGNIVQNRIRGLKLLAIKAPGFGDRLKNRLEDLAVILGGKVISKDSGNKVADFDLSWLGKCDKIICDADNTTLIGGAGTEEDRQVAMSKLTGLIKSCKTEVDAKWPKERLASLHHKIVLLRVGGLSDVAVKEKKDRIDDALCAVNAAKEDGILPGGGSALLHVKKQPNNLSDAQKAGYDLLYKCLEAPLYTIAKNAGEKADYIVAKVKDSNTFEGWDAVSNSFVNMVSVGIIDPTKVTKCALQNAAQIASLLFTTSHSVLLEKKEK